ncbi:MAG: hypothetical protein ACOY93_14230 [Bacillota bacterium]
MEWLGLAVPGFRGRIERALHAAGVMNPGVFFATEGGRADGV